MSTVRSQSVPSLSDVEHAFAIWRRERQSHEPTPLALRRQAVALLETHRPSFIYKPLGIPSSTLKRWAQELRAPQPGEQADTLTPTGFVVLPEPAAGGDVASTADRECHLTL